MCLVYALNSEKREHLLKTASGSDKVTIKNISKASSAPRQTFEMDPFAKKSNRLELLTILADTYIKNATPDVWQGPGFTYSKKCLVKRGEYQSSKLKIWSGNFFVSWLKCFISSLLPLSWILVKTFLPYAHVESINLFLLSSGQWNAIVVL